MLAQLHNDKPGYWWGLALIGFWNLLHSAGYSPATGWHWQREAYFCNNYWSIASDYNGTVSKTIWRKMLPGNHEPVVLYNGITKLLGESEWQDTLENLSCSFKSEETIMSSFSLCKSLQYILNHFPFHRQGRRLCVPHTYLVGELATQNSHKSKDDHSCLVNPSKYRENWQNVLRCVWLHLSLSTAFHANGVMQKRWNNCI